MRATGLQPRLQRPNRPIMRRHDRHFFRIGIPQHLIPNVAKQPILVLIKALTAPLILSAISDPYLLRIL